MDSEMTRYVNICFILPFRPGIALAGGFQYSACPSIHSIITFLSVVSDLIFPLSWPSCHYLVIFPKPNLYPLAIRRCPPEDEGSSQYCSWTHGFNLSSWERHRYGRAQRVTNWGTVVGEHLTQKQSIYTTRFEFWKIFFWPWLKLFFRCLEKCVEQDNIYHKCLGQLSCHEVW